MTGGSDRREIEDMAARIVAADFGDGPAPMVDALDRYLTRDPRRASLYCEMAQLWETLGELPEPALAATPVDSGRWWDRLPYRRIAAGLLPCLLLVGMLAGGGLDWMRGRDEAVALSTGAAERRILVLSDGSTVTLSARSALAVHLGADARRLTLTRGEAIFEVAHDPSRPFIVSAAGGEVMAVGTAFNIRLDGGGAIVTVIEGRVNVVAGAGLGADGARPLSQLAGAGQQVAYGSAGPDAGPAARQSFITPARRVDAPRIVEWSRGLLRFNGEPLSQVVDEVNRHSLHRIRILDPELGRTPIYGVLHIGDEQGLISIIRDMGGRSEALLRRQIRVERADDELGVNDG